MQPLLESRWPGRWLAPDFPGHGGSAPLDSYTFGSFAAAVAGLVSSTDRVVVLGHSMGGVVGLELANGRFGADVAGVAGFGIKVSWTAAELERAQALAQRPVTWFDSWEEAADRYLRVSGLAGLVDRGDDRVSQGLRHQSGRWCLALDPSVFGVGAPDMTRLLAEAQAPVVVARGEHDELVSQGQLAALVPDPVCLLGLGHNAQVEDPAAVLELLQRIGF